MNILLTLFGILLYLFGLGLLLVSYDYRPVRYSFKFDCYMIGSALMILVGVLMFIASFDFLIPKLPALIFFYFVFDFLYLIYRKVLRKWVSCLIQKLHTLVKKRK